jgi:hypothetical protein
MSLRKIVFTVRKKDLKSIVAKLLDLRVPFTIYHCHPTLIKASNIIWRIPIHPFRVHLLKVKYLINRILMRDKYIVEVRIDAKN